MPLTLPLSTFLLDICNAFTNEPAPQEFLELLNTLDRTGFIVSDFDLTETDTIQNFNVRLPSLPDGEFQVEVPGLPFIVLVFSNESLGDLPGFEVVQQLVNVTHLEFNHLRAGLRIVSPLIRSVNAGENLDLLYSGDLHLQKDWRFRLLPDAALNLRPVEIGTTGLVLAATNVEVFYTIDPTHTGITTLGLGASFRGIYAQHCVLKLLPQSFFGNTPGLEIEFEHAAIDEKGVTASVRGNYDLRLNNNQFDSTSGMVGYLFDPSWQLAVGVVEVDLVQNEPRRVFLDGYLRLPVLDTLFRCNFGLTSGFGHSYTSTFNLHAETPLVASVGPVTLTLHDFQANGTIGDDHLLIAGVLSGTLAFPGFEIDVDQAALTMEHTSESDDLHIALTEVNFGPLGVVETAFLVVKSVTDTETGNRHHHVQMGTTLAWADIHARLKLERLPDNFPLPPDDGRVNAFLEWESAPSTHLTMRLEAELPHVNALWSAIPANYRPLVRDVRFTSILNYKDNTKFSSSTTNDTLKGELSASFFVKLPDLSGLPGHELILIDSGDADGWIKVVLRASLRPNADTGNLESRLVLDIADPFNFDVQLPGLPQPQAPIHTSIREVLLDLTVGTALDGTFTMTGDFLLHPVQPPSNIPFADHLINLLEPLALGDQTGTATLVLKFHGERAELVLNCVFNDAHITIDVFDLMANLARGISGDTGDLKESPLDLDVSFSLQGVRLQIGSLKEEAANVSLEMVVGLAMAGISTEMFFEVSDREFTIGFAKPFPIPLELPRFPLGLDDLDRLKGPDGLWNISIWKKRLKEMEADIEDLGDAKDVFEAKAHLQAQYFLLQNLLGIFKLLRGPENRQAYEMYSTLMIGYLQATTSALHFDTNLNFVLNGRYGEDGSKNEQGVKFVLPFADPRNIGVFGAAHLSGFAPTDPFYGLEGLTLGLGLTADMLFFSVDSFASPIPIPQIGPYDGGVVNLSRLRFGYGFTRNSLAINFAGEVTFPPQLVEDADTSEQIGFGIRLPKQAALSFRLDLIPVTLGPIDFIMPLLEFDLDMRTQGHMVIPDGANCTPNWDGLQFIADGISRGALRHAAISPVFGMFYIPNMRLDGAIMLGDDRNGLTVVLNNTLVLFGIMASATPLPVPIPFLADPMAPYFDNLCVNLRIAGFGIQFNLQRPFPSFSPLTLFEVLGLLSDPLFPIDPNGSLANTIRVALSNGRLTAPPEFVRMFPGLAGIINKDVAVGINLGTFISAVQTVVHVGEEVVSVVEETESTIRNRLKKLQKNPPDLKLSKLLALLPPELRKIRAGGSLGGFDARVVILLVDSRDVSAIKAAFTLRGKRGTSKIIPKLGLNTPISLEKLERFRPNLPAVSRTIYPDDPQNSLFQGLEFKAFVEADFGRISRPDETKAGVVMGAHVKLPNGQRFRFLGYLFEDGSFSMISSAEIKPILLTVYGISLPIQMELDARLMLQGRTKREGFYGSIKAEGHAIWKLLPGIAELQIANRENPANIELFSDGHFRANAAARLVLYNRSAVVEGVVDLSETHCFLQGNMQYSVAPFIEIDVDCSGRIGPGLHYNLECYGNLKILGVALTSVRGMISENRAEFEARLNTPHWPLGGINILCGLDLAVKGNVNLQRRTNPEFAFEGSGSIAVFGAEIEGRAGIVREDGALKTYAEGALSWHGKRWLEGRIEIGTQRVAISGQTSFMIDLELPNPFGVDLANLYFKCDLEGAFTINNRNGITNFNIKGDWSLGVRAAVGDQLFPLAAQSFAGSGEASLEIELIVVKNINLLPLGDVKIKLPRLTTTDPTNPLRIGKVDGNEAFSVNGITMVLKRELGLPIPVFGIGNLTRRQTTSIVNLNYSLSFEDTSLVLPLSCDFSIYLVWHDGRLALKIEQGTDVKFVIL